MRIILDTNVFVSATLIKNSNPDKVLQAWRRGEVEFITSRLLLEELEDVLNRPHLRRLQWLKPDEVDALVAEFKEAAIHAPGVLHLSDVVRDVKDDKIISAAVEMQVDYIVSGDDDLLVLKEYKGIPVVSPAGFLKILEERIEEDEG